MKRELVPHRRPHLLLNFFYAHIEHTLGIGFYDPAETKVAEIFIDTHKHGTALAANARDAAVVTSIALQYGAALRTIDAALNRAEPPKGQPGPGEPAGVIGAAMDRLREERPELFDKAPEPAKLSVVVSADTAAVREALAATQARLEEIALSHAGLSQQLAAALLRAEEAERENQGLHDQVAALSDELAQLDPDLHGVASLPTRQKRQDAYADMVREIWGEETMVPAERIARFSEEAIEAMQALGLSWPEFQALAQEVYSRPAGEPEQEIGGVQTTLLALCTAYGVDADELEVREIKRVLAKDPNVLRARHQQKVDRGFAVQGKRAEEIV